MIMAISIIYFIYVLIKVYLSVMQAGYVLKAKNQKPVLMLPSKFIKSARYTAKKEKIAIVETIVEYLLFIFWIGFGLEWLDKNIVIDNIVLKSVVYVDIFLAINYIVGLPFDYYQKFVLDEKFGFNKSTLALFIKDQIKGILLFLIFGSLIIAAVSYIILNFQNWWIWGFLFVFGIIILINAIYPTLIAPIFNKFKPLEDKELEKDIHSLLNRSGFKSKGVFVVDASKRDNRLNAYFGGLGKTKRVVLFDTLVNKLSKDELLAVLGHELGHFVNKDILKNIFMMAIMMFALFFIFANLPQELFTQIGISNQPYTIITLFLLLSPVFTFFFMPLISFVSRKNEYAADNYGASLTSKSSLRNALLKLVEENSQFPLSHPFYIFFYYSHPPILERLKNLGFQEDEETSKEALREKCVTEEELDN
ncbi:M48 family metallopeptidase [Nitrosophilus kaiyonis]|uniref:M48 family metallopeptidase n=1 Tax=Nitrosophilus kaiyonis TaxID=2930200 RepID=UPI00249107FD|nr:M48 family metallopeptidase [Nitrosophilus kaiyonis]